MCCAPSVSFGSNCQMPVLIQRCNSVIPPVLIQHHITVILESLPKPGYDTLGDSKFFGYFQLVESGLQMIGGGLGSGISNILDGVEGGLGGILKAL